MKLKPCTIKRCDKPANWTVTVADHPNVSGPQSWEYCAVHVSTQAIVWDDSPTPYSITIKGPHKRNR